MHEGPNVTGSVRSLVDETLSAWEPMFSALDDTWQAWTRGLSATTSRPSGHRHGECRGCRGRCECNGCDADADVVLTARTGERRVVPIEVRNPTHRDVVVSIDPGPWTSCDGNQLAVRSAVRPEGDVTIAGCSSREFLLVVEVGGAIDEQGKPGDVRTTTTAGTSRCAAAPPSPATCGSTGAGRRCG